MADVAIVGGGPGGLVAARYLKSQGFDPVLFEQAKRIGGQWSADPITSGVWPGMRANTSRVMTAFSDLAHDPRVGIYPTNQTVRDYLQRYAEQFDILSSARLGTRVETIARGSGGYAVRSRGPDGVVRDEWFERVVVATGRYHKPSIPAVPGLATFPGKGSVAHTFAYKEPERYRGQRVLVAGCAISALEVASDLAMLGAARVVSTNRRQRYIVQKMTAGMPVDHSGVHAVRRAGQ